jgi:hypothetical protein
MLRFLGGTPWEELFEPEVDEGGATPPAWLKEWSSGWKSAMVFSIDEMDPYWTDAWLVTDASNGESWFVVEECGESLARFERVADNAAMLRIALVYLKSIGDFPVLGRFRVNPARLPLPWVREFMESAMKGSGMTCLRGDPGLTLERWLREEYPSDPPSP